METAQGNEGDAVPPVSPAMATRFISQGEHQIVQVDSKSMLGMVMQALGSKKPRFKETDCGAQGTMITVTIDVSCARYYSGEKTHSAVIEGEPNSSKMLAERSAFLRAIDYLREKHHVKVIDFSRKIVHGIEGSGTFGNVNAALYSLEKLIGQWEITLVDCKELLLKLEDKVAETDGVAHGYGNLDIYRAHKEFIQSIVAVYKEKLTDAKSKASALEFMREKYHQRSTDRSNSELMTGWIQPVVVPQKMILDYVLGYMGSGRATYTSSPTTYGMMKGEATFYIKPVPGCRCSGNIRIKGKGGDSTTAEEAAAYKALLYIEDSLNIKVHDINHAARVHAEEERKRLILLFEQIIHEFDEVKYTWERMIKYVGKEHTGFVYEQTFVFQDEEAAKKNEANSFCGEQMELLEKNSVKRFQNCAERFEEMRKLGCKLSALKAEIGLD